MIQKRYEYFGPKGKTFTNWFNINNDDSKLPILQRDEKWHVKNKLLNEFRIV